MIKATEIAPGVWLFQGEEHNAGAVLEGAHALLVDPGLPAAVEQFLSDMGTTAEAAFFTHSPQSEVEQTAAWAHLSSFGPGSFTARSPLPMSIPGWEAVPLAGRDNGQLALYNPQEGILLCGDILPDPQRGIPLLNGGAEAYLQNLDLIESLDPRLVAPRRGDPGMGKRAIKARIEHSRNYTNALVRHISTSSVAGLTPARLLEVAASLYDDSPYLQDHLQNMKYVWEEWTPVTSPRTDS